MRNQKPTRWLLSRRGIKSRNTRQYMVIKCSGCLAMSKSSTLLHSKKVIVIGGSSGIYFFFELGHKQLNLQWYTGIGYGVAAAALSNGASVVISSSSQAKVGTAVEKLKQSIEDKNGITVTGQTFDIRDYSALTSFLTKEAPFDHLVSHRSERQW